VSFAGGVYGERGSSRDEVAIGRLGGCGLLTSRLGVTDVGFYELLTRTLISLSFICVT